MWAVKEFRKRRKCREWSFYSLSKKGEGHGMERCAALRGGGVELLLDYSWIKKRWGVAVVWPLGCWGIVTGGFSLFQCYLPPVAVRSC